MSRTCDPSLSIHFNSSSLSKGLAFLRFPIVLFISCSVKRACSTMIFPIHGSFANYCLPLSPHCLLSSFLRYEIHCIGFSCFTTCLPLAFVRYVVLAHPHFMRLHPHFLSESRRDGFRGETTAPRPRRVKHLAGRVTLVEALSCVKFVASWHNQ